jgi:hypothetical protein
VEVLAVETGVASLFVVVAAMASAAAALRPRPTAGRAWALAAAGSLPALTLDPLTAVDNPAYYATLQAELNLPLPSTTASPSAIGNRRQGAAATQALPACKAGHLLHPSRDEAGTANGQDSEARIAQLEREVVQLRAVGGEPSEHRWRNDREDAGRADTAPQNKLDELSHK